MVMGICGRGRRGGSGISREGEPKRVGSHVEVGKLIQSSREAGEEGIGLGSQTLAYISAVNKDHRS